MKVYLCPLIIFLCSCASIVAPTGGDVDKTPPLIKNTEPENGSVNFKAEKIVITFDEYIQLKDPQQIIISPPLEKKPDYLVKGKRFEVVLNEPLKPNTTYTINFGNAIADNNEGNIADNINYIFSTGTEIDSLTLKGKVIDAFDLTANKDAIIALYKNTPDTSIYKSKPYYIVKPDKDGNFLFHNLSPGEYLLLSFEDINKNLLVENNEKIAFITNYVKLDYGVYDTIQPSYKLLLSKQDINGKATLVQARETNKGKYTFTFNATDCGIKIYNEGTFKKDNSLIIRSKNCDTVLFYTNLECTDSTHFEIEYSDKRVETTTVFCNTKKFNEFRLNSQTNNSNFNYHDSLKLIFSNPILDIRPSTFSFYRDSIKLEAPAIKFNAEQDPFSITIPYKWEEKTKYLLMLPKGSITDYYNQDIDSLQISISTAGPESFGNLSITVNNENSELMIVQLINKDGAVEMERIINKTTTLPFTNIAPSMYKVKVIQDKNKNGKWDHGDFLTRTQPESVYITPNSIEVRANWEVADISITPVF